MLLFYDSVALGLYDVMKPIKADQMQVCYPFRLTADLTV